MVPSCQKFKCPSLVGCFSSSFVDNTKLTRSLNRADDAITDVVFNLGSILFPLGMSINPPPPAGSF